MWRAESRERGAQLGRGDGDVAGVGERRLHESARLVVGAVVVRREPADEIDPGLDDVAGDDVADRDPPGTQQRTLVWLWYAHPPTVPACAKPGQVWVRTPARSAG